MSTQSKLGIGSVLAIAGVLGIVLSQFLGWTEAPQPWAFLLGFIFGVAVGLGGTLVIAGLIERRRGE